MSTSTDLVRQTESAVGRIWKKVEAFARAKISRDQCDDVTFYTSSIANDVCNQLAGHVGSADKGLFGNFLSKSLLVAKMRIAKAFKREIIVRGTRISDDVESQQVSIDMEEIADGISPSEKVFLDVLYQTGSIDKAAKSINVSVATAKRMKRRLLLAIRENVKGK